MVVVFKYSARERRIISVTTFIDKCSDNKTKILGYRCYHLKNKYCTDYLKYIDSEKSPKYKEVNDHAY